MVCIRQREFRLITFQPVLPHRVARFVQIQGARRGIDRLLKGSMWEYIRVCLAESVSLQIVRI
jgi:hypothetical protein